MFVILHDLLLWLSFLVVQVFDKSVIVNKVNGDCTLILNDESWLRKRYLVTRLLILLMQYAAANRYPASTPSVNALYNRLLEAFEIHQEEKKAWLSKMPASLRVPEGQLQPFDKTKRVAMQQHTLANCAFYSLSRVDAMRRIALQGKLEKRQLEYGPAFLIQRDPPSRSQIVASREPEITLGPTDSYLWDDRIYLSFEHVPTLDNPNPSGSRTFKISFMQPSDVKEFEALTKSMPSVRRRVYAFLGTTPGTHLYQIPVVKEVGADYTAFPTLKADFPVGKYKWKTSYAGTSILASRFLCLP